MGEIRAFEEEETQMMRAFGELDSGEFGERVGRPVSPFVREQRELPDQFLIHQKHHSAAVRRGRPIAQLNCIPS